MAKMNLKFLDLFDGDIAGYSKRRGQNKKRLTYIITQHEIPFAYQSFARHVFYFALLLLA